MSRGTPRFSSDTRSAVGSVAFDDDVEKAVSITVRMRRKKSRGEMRESTATEMEYTPNMCSASPPRTVNTNQASATSRSKPKRAVVVNSRHATAKGAIHMTMSMIFAETWKSESNIATSGSVTDAGSRVMAIARTTAKNIRWSMFGVSPATAAIGFAGTSVRTTCIRAERSEEHTSELQSLAYLVCRLLLEKKKNIRASRCSHTLVTTQQNTLMTSFL